MKSNFIVIESETGNKRAFISESVKTIEYSKENDITRIYFDHGPCLTIGGDKVNSILESLSRSDNQP